MGLHRVRTLTAHGMTSSPVNRPAAMRRGPSGGNFSQLIGYITDLKKEATMTFGKGALLWLIGIPLPIILLLALFWR